MVIALQVLIVLHTVYIGSVHPKGTMCQILQYGHCWYFLYVLLHAGPDPSPKPECIKRAK